MKEYKIRIDGNADERLKEMAKECGTKDISVFLGKLVSSTIHEGYEMLMRSRKDTKSDN